METTNPAIPEEEKAKIKVACALNQCAVSVSKIIDSKNIAVLKQEREFILNNINLQNFAKDDVLLDIIREILDTITFLEIQAGDLSFIEKEYRQKQKTAILSAFSGCNTSVLLAGVDPLTTVISLLARIGIGYMNYRRIREENASKKEREEWLLKKYELEQLYGLRAKLFETAWKLSREHNFDDKYRLSEHQLSRFSEAILEEDPIKRFVRFDVMSKKGNSEEENFRAFPPFWYYKGNAAMKSIEVYKGKNDILVNKFKKEAIKAYERFENQNKHLEFFREDVIAAACCLEHISLFDNPFDENIPRLLKDSLRFAGDNYDVLQQCVFVNIRLKKEDEIILTLKELVANDYNVEINAPILYDIFQKNHNEIELDLLSDYADGKLTMKGLEGGNEND